MGECELCRTWLVAHGDDGMWRNAEVDNNGDGCVVATAAVAAILFLERDRSECMKRAAAEEEEEAIVIVIVAVSVWINMCMLTAIK